ncbi:MAG: CDP-alcohol phosphatidyltransferase family protein [Bacteroidota bacterium]
MVQPTTYLDFWDWKGLSTWDKWSLTHNLLVLILVAAYFFSQQKEGLLLGILLFFLPFLYQLSKQRPSEKLWTYANGISFFRLGLLLFFGFFPTYFSTTYNFMLIGTAIFLDGLDGWLARKMNQETRLGAFLDLKIDAFLVLLLSLHWVEAEKTFSLFWLLGCLHYGYEWFLFLINKYLVKTRRNPIGKYAAAFLFISLLTPFLLPQTISYPILVAAFGSTFVSFGISLGMKIKVF